MKNLFFAADPARKALTDLVKELAWAKLPSREDFADTEAWLAACHPLLPEATWKKLVLTTL
jgi:hypothetical protein